MKRLFGEIHLTWRKLIIFALVAGAYTALMALIPATNHTSFRDIAVFFEWWILFGIIIICNSKSPTDSALKCFVFFLISQPLVYLIQVPFSDMGWKLFGYYRYWFYWKLDCLPMGFIGYSIKKKNWLSVLILSPMIVALVFMGLGYINSAIESFPHHLLSGIACFSIITIVILSLFEEKKYRFVSFGIALITAIVILILNNGIGDTKFETYRELDAYNITFDGNPEITSTSGNKEGNVDLIEREDGNYNVKLTGWYSGKYTFSIEDKSKNRYDFEYYFDKENNTVVLKRIE